MALHKIAAWNYIPFVILIVAVFQVSHGSLIRFQPNTLLEFKSLKCSGNYDREQYVFLNQICDECYNLFRVPGVMTKCKSNCFRNFMFPMCTTFLSLDHRKEEINEKVNLVNGF